MARSDKPTWTAFSKGSESDARAFLSGLGITIKPTAKYPEGSPDYVRRLANNLARASAAGVPLNRETARGHGTTREHPNREAPRNVPAPAVQQRYKVPSSKTVYRPDGTLDYRQTRSASEAARTIRHIAATEGPHKQIAGTTRHEAGTRVDIRVWDPKAGIWRDMFSNQKGGKHKPGISASYLADRLADGESLDDIIDDVWDSYADTPYAGGGAYQVIVY